MTIKAFELVPAIEGVQLMGEKAKTTIECIECCAQHLYIGTSDSFVIHYQVVEKSVSAGKIGFQADKQGHKYLGVKKSVKNIKAAPSINHLLVLCDSVISLLNMISLEPVPTGAKVKSVTSFCLNEGEHSKQPFCVDICVATKKKFLQVHRVTEDRILPLKEIAVPELPLLVAMDNQFICVAMVTQYAVVNYETGHMMDLFPYESDIVAPSVKRLRKEEFLLSGPSCLGMFVTTEGVSPHPPLQWSDHLVGLGYSHPYIISVNNLFIMVHSVLDQQQKQIIPFQGGRCVGEFEGHVFIASSKDIYALIPVPWEKQVQTLLADGCVSEALELAKNSNKAGFNKDKFIKLFRRIQQQAGFIELSQFHFDEARELFRASHVDVRELISLYPMLMPSKTSFTRSVPPLHDLADINQFTRGNAELLLQCKQFLINYLEDVRLSRGTAEVKQEIDTALIKLYAEFNSAHLIPLISGNSCDLNDCTQSLELYGRYYALGLLYRFRGDDDHALQVWIRIVNKEVEDESFPGLHFIAEILANLPNHELVFKYSEWVLEKNQELGIKIFTERPENEQLSERLRPELVAEFLHRFPVAVIKYLEYLVFIKKLEKETFHTHLVVLYLDKVLHLLKSSPGDEEKISQARQKLQNILRMSSLYRVQLILGKIHNTDLYAESAILYGKLEEHDTALKLLVHKLSDYSGALQYCLYNSDGREACYRRHLFQALLLVYLDSNQKNSESLLSPAIDLLNSELADFETVKILPQIPGQWAIRVLSHFLMRSICINLHRRRSRRIERMLARGENIQLKAACIKFQKEVVNLTDDSICSVCNRNFLESAFVRYPNGTLTHLQCARNRRVCPATGKIFSTKRENS